MATLSDVINPQRVNFTTDTKRSIASIEGVVEQSFSIKVYGLLLNADLNLYVNRKKVPSSQVALKDRPSSTFSTDSKGEADFIFYYRENLSELNGVSEAKFLEYLDRNSGEIELVLVDKASVNGDQLTDNDIKNARCLAVCKLNRSYNPIITQTNDIIIDEIDRTSSPQPIITSVTNNTISSNTIVTSGNTNISSSKNPFERSLTAEKSSSSGGNSANSLPVSSEETSSTRSRLRRRSFSDNESYRDFIKRNFPNW